MIEKTWDILWHNLNIATMAPKGAAYGLIENAAIAIKNGRIAWLGPQAELTPALYQQAAQVHDGQQRCLTPGLIDSHTHVIYGGNRAREFEMRLQGMSYQQIAEQGGGILSTVENTRNASATELLESALKRIKAMVAQGVTALEIKSGYGLDLESEMKMLQTARTLAQHLPITIKTTFLGAHALPPEFAREPDRYINYLCDEMLPTLAEANLVDAVDAFCENIGFTPQQVRRVFETALALNLPIKCHAEQLSDQQGAALAAEFHGLSADHLEYASEESIAAMAKANTVAVLLPGAFYFLRETKQPPLALLRQYKVPIALASDCNPGSSPTTSLLLMLNMACTLWRMTPEEALTGITRHAAQALGLNVDYGTLEIGKYADMVLWDIAHPAELSYSFGTPFEAQVFKHGRLITF